MCYQYQCRIKPVDIWKLSMRRTYRSLVGMCNLVFGTAMILLTVRFWNQAGDLAQALLFAGCLLIPVIQPVGVYLKAKAQASVIPQDTELTFDEEGIHVALKDEREFIRWSKVRGVRKEGSMIIIYTDANHGYMLTKRVLGSEKDAFYQHVKACMNT